MSVINASLIPNPFTQTFVLNSRIDLTASDVPTAGSGKYVVLKLSPPKGSVLAVKSIIPYANRRIQVGAADEDFEMLAPAQANGHFIFEVAVNQGGALLNQDLNVPDELAASPLNSDRQLIKGIDCVSEQPYFDLLRTMDSDTFNILLDESGVLQVIFSLADSNMGGAYTVGGAGNKRVDFAGVYIGGAQMNKQDFDRAKNALYSAPR